MACMQNNYQQRENSDSLILVELLMLSCTLMSFRHVWDIALALDTPSLRSDDLLDTTMRSSPGALGHNQGVVMVPNVEKMMMFKWLWDHFLRGLIAWPHPSHELRATNVYELSGHYQTNNLHQFHISYQLQLQLQTCTNCPMLRSTQHNILRALLIFAG